jgi:hypothetical protein
MYRGRFYEPNIAMAMLCLPILLGRQDIMKQIEEAECGCLAAVV